MVLASKEGVIIKFNCASVAENVLKGYLTKKALREGDYFIEEINDGDSKTQETNK